jgi:peptide/nickel transport system permease protein
MADDATSTPPASGAAPAQPRPSPLQRSLGILGLLRESPVGMVGAALVAFWILMAILAPVLPLYDPLNPMVPFQAMGATAPDGGTFWLGTDHRGRDILSRVIWSSQRVLIWATLATVVAYVAGMAMGCVAGYLGGWWDEVISFLANVLLSFPVMILFVIIVTVLGASGMNIVIAVTFASAPAIMRIVRGLILDLRTRDYVFAAQTRGESPWFIMLVELLPNARGPLIVDACLRLGYTVVAIATLGFLGLGLPPPSPDWGMMIKEAVPLGSFAGREMVIPAIALSSLILGFNMLADGLREISLRD